VHAYLLYTIYKNIKMALLVKSHKFIFLHPPKTGGTWVGLALTRAGLRVANIGTKHGHLCCDREVFELVKSEKYFIMTTVRNPVDWYISHWNFMLMIKVKSYKDGKGWMPFAPWMVWHPTWDIDVDCGSSDFSEFAEGCLERYPAFLTHLFNLYVKVPPVGEVDYIAKTETLTEDLIKVLRLLKVSFDESVIRKMPHANVSKSHCDKYCPRLLQRLLDSERAMAKRFGYPLTI
jgi:hypothetical protein